MTFGWLGLQERIQLLQELLTVPVKYVEEAMNKDKDSSKEVQDLH